MFSDVPLIAGDASDPRLIDFTHIAPFYSPGSGAERISRAVVIELRQTCLCYAASKGCSMPTRNGRVTKLRVRGRLATATDSGAGLRLPPYLYLQERSVSPTKRVGDAPTKRLTSGWTFAYTEGVAPVIVSIDLCSVYVS